MEKTLFENDQIKVVDTGKDYDFIAYVENKTDKQIAIVLDEKEIERKSSEFIDGEYEVFDKSDYATEEEADEAFDEYISGFDYIPQNFLVPSNDWVGILADPAGRATVELLKERNYSIENEFPSENW